MGILFLYAIFHFHFLNRKTSRNLTVAGYLTFGLAWGSGMTEFSDGGASGETEEKAVFTDEPEVEKEKEQPVAAAGVPEVENGFSDGENVCGLVDNDTAAENINQGQKHAPAPARH